MSHKATAVLTLPLLAAYFCYPQQRSSPNRASVSGHDLHGKHLFASSCAGCHGLDGTGSERAPNIASNPEVQKLSTSEILRIVSGGIPGKGMPPFLRLGKPAMNEIVTYVRELQGKSKSVKLPGDPDRGQTIFFGSAQCSTCHMAEGRGGFIAPDLSTYAQTHTVAEMKSAITNPSERDSNKSMVTAITVNGERYEGIIRNEDNFSLQLQSTDGAFHFLSRSELKTIERSPGSIMPSDYASRLSETQLNDIVSYLLSIGNTSAPTNLHSQYED